jgi:methylmalonyl-CoA mutase
VGEGTVDSAHARVSRASRLPETCLSLRGKPAYEAKKHDDSFPVIGVNTFRNPHGDPVPEHLELIRSSEEEKQSQLKRLRDFQKRNAKQAPAMLKCLQDAVRVCSLGKITHALFEVGGQYRRSM